VDARAWAALAGRWQEEAGLLEAAGIHDWLCTPGALESTRLTVARHQELTVRSFLELRDLAPGVPWVPTVQGWLPDDYLHHVELYSRAGVDLTLELLVGVGSIAQRQETPTAARVLERLHDDAQLGNLHAFGAKFGGLGSWGWAVRSADSMAWSWDARRMGYSCARHPGDCRNCQWYAEHWGRRLERLVGNSRQLTLNMS